MKRCASGAGDPGHRSARLVAYVALSGLLAGVEGLLLPPTLPFRPGLANTVVVIALVRDGASLAGQVMAGKVLLGALLSGTFLGLPFWLSAIGGLASWIGMALFNQAGAQRISPVGLSVVGATAHLGAQAVVVSWVTGVSLRMLIPPLGVTALLGGLLTGFLAAAILVQLQPDFLPGS